MKTVLIYIFIIFLALFNKYSYSIIIQYQQNTLIENQFFIFTNLNKKIHNIAQLNPKEQIVFFSILNSQICPHHSHNNLSYCLCQPSFCKTSFYLAEWIYKKIKRKYPKTIISKILSQEIYEGIKSFPKKIFIENYHQKGSCNNNNIIIEYGDLECIHCKKISKLLTLLLNKYPYEIKIIYKHFPISFHKNAKILSIISESFKKQEHFWLFLDYLYNANTYNMKIIQYFLKTNNISLKIIRQKTFDKQIYCKIINSITEARKIMLVGVPAIFFNYKKYNLSLDLFSLETRLKIEKKG